MTVPAGLEERIPGVLDDGTLLLFRLIRPDDRDRLREGFERLSPESRYRRFFSPLDHLSDELLHYLTEIDYQDHIAWVAVLPDVAGEPLLGVGRWIRSTLDPEEADAAVTVADEYHRRGIGRALLRLMARSAIERDVRRFTADVLSDNEGMITLFRQVGAELHHSEGSVLQALVPLPATIEELEHSPAPRILRATAEGKLTGRSGARGVGIDFVEAEGAD
jgi:ribosomal protein S18 acetylase RimI-like enzyme